MKLLVALLLWLILGQRQAILAREVDTTIAMEVELEACGQLRVVVSGRVMGLYGHLVVEADELVDERPGLILGEWRLERIQDVVQSDALLRAGALMEGLTDELAAGQDGSNATIDGDSATQSTAASQLLRVIAIGRHVRDLRVRVLLGIPIGAVRRCRKEALLGVLELRIGLGWGGHGYGLGVRLGLRSGGLLCIRRLVFGHPAGRCFNPILVEIQHWPTYIWNRIDFFAFVSFWLVVFCCLTCKFHLFFWKFCLVIFWV